MGSLTASPDALGTPEELVRIIQDLYTVNLSVVASTSWLAYDIVATLPREVTLIWRAKWSVPKVFYFIVRYYTLVTLCISITVFTSTTVTASFCRRYHWYATFNGTLLTAAISEAMFLMRLWASYQRSKRILVLICVAFSIQVIAGPTIATLSLLRIKFYDRPPNFPIPGCILTTPDLYNSTVVAWSFALLTTCIYFLLVLRKFAHNVSLRRNSSIASRVPLSELESVSPLIYAFVRDSAFYFLLAFLGNLANLLCLIIFKGRPLLEIAFSWLAVVYAVSASRLCLNTRQSLRRRGDGDGGDRYETETETDTGFFDPIELDDRTRAGASLTLPRNASRRASQVPSALAPLGGLAQGDGSGSSVGKQRSTFESMHSKHDGQSRASTDKNASEEDYGLIAMEPWIILERDRDLL